MGWADCGVDSNGRPIGYAFDATCDLPAGCDTKIDRGLAYACGDMHGEGSDGKGDGYCEKYFCSGHLIFTDFGWRCQECVDAMEDPFGELENE